jgi:hypothetical protein
MGGKLDGRVSGLDPMALALELTGSAGDLSRLGPALVSLFVATEASDGFSSGFAAAF